VAADIRWFDVASYSSWPATVVLVLQLKERLFLNISGIELQPDFARVDVILKSSYQPLAWAMPAPTA
jgi:hypothetical protein